MNAQATTASPTCGPAWAAGARSGTTTGTGGSDALSLLASTDRLAGEATSLAGETHEGSDYAGFPGIPRGRYPKGDLIRIVLGDVSARTPAKARRYLPYVPGRLGLVSAPKLRFPAGFGRGPLLEEGPPDAVRHPGVK